MRTGRAEGNGILNIYELPWLWGSYRTGCLQTRGESLRVAVSSWEIRGNFKTKL